MTESRPQFADAEARLTMAVDGAALSVLNELEQQGLIGEHEAKRAAARIRRYARNQLHFRWLGEKPHSG